MKDGGDERKKENNFQKTYFALFSGGIADWNRDEIWKSVAMEEKKFGKKIGRARNRERGGGIKLAQELFAIVVFSFSREGTRG